MKKTKQQLGMIGTVLLSTLFVTPSVFAANPYGIEYTGGAVLGEDNVQINSSLVESLTPLMRTTGNVEMRTSSSSRIKSGYLRSGSNGGQCREVKYVTVSNGDLVSVEDDIVYYLTQGQYTISVKFKNVILENASNSRIFSVGMGSGTSILYTGYQIYEDANCRTMRSGIDALSVNQGSGERVLVDMDIKVFNKNNLQTPLTINNLYFGLTDIDMAQSYKILNEGNKLEKSRMYALNAENLQAQPVGSTFRNMFVENGNYIYSEYSFNGRTGTLNLYDVSNVYTNINQQTQSEGLNVVLGFATGAYNGIEYYSYESAPETVRITYRSDENGAIVGEDTEDITINSNPSGSSSRPNENYEFSHWVANKNVTLRGGATIVAGEPISSEQVSMIVASEDIVLTAVHKTVVIPDEPGDDEPGDDEPGDDTPSDDKPSDDTPKEDEKQEDDSPAIPNTGMNTGNISLAVATVSIFGIVAVAMIIKLLPKFTHKGIDFKK